MSRRRGAGKPANLNPVQMRVVGYAYAAIFFLLFYCFSMGSALFETDSSWADKTAAVLLGLGMLFILIHGVGYANSIIKASWGYRETRTHLFASSSAPSVACVVASFNEPESVLDETVGAVVALDYPRKVVYILDDSTREEAKQAAQRIAAKYGVECLQRTNRRGYKAGAINDFLPRCKQEFVAFFDADALPASNFLQDLVPLLEENPRLAFLQTPQYYANTEVSHVAMASSRQQNVFYEYICEGKSYSRAQFCCGTNVIFSLKALNEVGGFDETSVTEDFATSFTLHTRGWDSLYFNRVYVYSLAPENLAAYFTQQSRWSFGTLSTARKFFKEFVRNPRALRWGQWWEYFLSATYYWVGWVNFIFMLLPLLYVFFGVKPVSQDVVTYLAVFVPYFLFTLTMFYAGMGARNYRLGEVVLGQQIGFISFPIHMVSAISGLLGQKRPFGVTPKGVGGRVPWRALWPQLTMLVLSAMAFAWGLYNYLAGHDRNTTAVIVNSMWALYHVWMLNSIFTLNQPVREGSKAYFEDPNQDAVSLLYPQVSRSPLSAPGLASKLVTGGVLTVLALGLYLGWGVLRWNATPETPINVYIVDKTVGQFGQEHRGLTWVLNYLKVRKAPTFGPAPAQRRETYSWSRDYYGFVPWQNPQLTRGPGKNGQLLAYGGERPLPTRLSPPGIMYLADTYGEFSQVDRRRGEVRVRSRARGMSENEIDNLGSFMRRGGLVVGEWNVLGYPTRPGRFVPRPELERRQTAFRQRRHFLQTRELPRLRGVNAAASGRNDFRTVKRSRDKIEDVRGELKDIQYKLLGLQYQMDRSDQDTRQLAAAQKLEKLLRVRYRNWYGRYVANFQDEKKYDPALWESVRASLSRRAGKNVWPRGPGFVFYPDGTQNIGVGEERKTSPFAEPIALLQQDLAGLQGAEIATIHRSGKAEVADDALLRGVASQVPFRSWFEVVEPDAGSRVLAYYKLRLAPTATSRLRAAGFPSKYISATGVVFPAAIAWRDGGISKGELRSFYFAGDASDFPLPSRAVERFPGLASLSSQVPASIGPYGNQYLWGYYEPLLRNVVQDSKRVRHGGK